MKLQLIMFHEWKKIIRRDFRKESCNGRTVERLFLFLDNHQLNCNFLHLQSSSNNNYLYFMQGSNKDALKQKIGCNLRSPDSANYLHSTSPYTHMLEVSHMFKNYLSRWSLASFQKSIFIYI